MTEDSDFEIGNLVGFAKVHHKIIPRRKRGRGSGLGSFQKFGVFPLIFMQWLKVYRLQIWYIFSVAN